MRDSVGLSQGDVLDMLKERGVICELVGEGPDARIRGGINGLVYFVLFFEPLEAQPSRFASICLRSGRILDLSVIPSKLLAICNDLNNTYRFLKFSIGGDNPVHATVSIDFDLSMDPRGEFLTHWENFEKTLLIFLHHIVQSDAVDNGNATSLHDQAVRARHDPVPDLSLAAELFRKAADMGFAGSQNNLGDMYELGDALPRSDVVAAYWYARAAERGEPTAYMSLATLLARTATDEEMLAEAAMYAILALQHLSPGHNSTTTASCFASLRNRLPPRAIEAATAKAANWMPLYQEMNLLSDTPDALAGYSSSSRNTH